MKYVTVAAEQIMRYSEPKLNVNGRPCSFYFFKFEELLSENIWIENEIGGTAAPLNFAEIFE